MDPLKNANVEENVVSKLRVCLDTAYFAKNQKHCSKIIFKCVNSVVGSIFNESFGKKKVCGSCEQYTRPTGKDRNMLLQKKKKKKKKPKMPTLKLSFVFKRILKVRLVY